MNERINDKVGISNTKLSFSEIAFNNKVNTLEPRDYKGDREDIAHTHPIP